MMQTGCKTTNAAILFRANDYMRILQGEIDDSDKEVAQLQSQVAQISLQKTVFGSKLKSETSLKSET